MRRISGTLYQCWWPSRHMNSPVSEAGCMSHFLLVPNGLPHKWSLLVPNRPNIRMPADIPNTHGCIERKWVASGFSARGPNVINCTLVWSYLLLCRSHLIVCARFWTDKELKQRQRLQSESYYSNFVHYKLDQPIPLANSIMGILYDTFSSTLTYHSICRMTSRN